MAWYRVGKSGWAWQFGPQTHAHSGRLNSFDPERIANSPIPAMDDPGLLPVNKRLWATINAGLGLVRLGCTSRSLRRQKVGGQCGCPTSGLIKAVEKSCNQRTALSDIRCRTMCRAFAFTEASKNNTGHWGGGQRYMSTGAVRAVVGQKGRASNDVKEALDLCVVLQGL